MNKRMFLALVLSVFVGFVNLAFAEDVSQGSQIVSAVEKVNINTASAEELAEMLKGVGVKKAEAIVEYRDKYGAFSSVDDLSQVKGIGEATLRKNKERIAL